MDQPKPFPTQDDISKMRAREFVDLVMTEQQWTSPPSQPEAAHVVSLFEQLQGGPSAILDSVQSEGCFDQDLGDTCSQAENCGTIGRMCVMTMTNAALHINAIRQDDPMVAASRPVEPFSF